MKALRISLVLGVMIATAVAINFFHSSTDKILIGIAMCAAQVAIAAVFYRIERSPGNN